MPRFDLREPGDWLCHYTDFKGLVGIVPSSSLKLGSYMKMNDPDESRAAQFAAVAGEDVKDVALAWRLAYAMARARTRWKLLAMTRGANGYRGQDKPFGYPWTSGSMWDRYADARKGVCLVFDSAGFRQALTPEAPTRIYRGPVRYTPGGFVTSDAVSTSVHQPDGRNGMRWNYEDLDRSMTDYVKSYRRDFFFRKTLDWRSEREYRFVVEGAPDDLPVYAHYGDTLGLVVLGECFPDAQLGDARLICERARAPLMQLRRDLHAGFPCLTRIG